jgi:hypothetical protein
MYNNIRWPLELWTPSSSQHVASSDLSTLFPDTSVYDILFQWETALYIHTNKYNSTIVYFRFYILRYGTRQMPNQMVARNIINSRVLDFETNVRLFSMIFHFTFISIYVILRNDTPAILLKILLISFTLQKQFASVSSNEQILVIIQHNNST